MPSAPSPACPPENGEPFAKLAGLSQENKASVELTLDLFFSFFFETRKSLQ
jgi:uncharacterized protein YdaU (DUF1376 family)